MWKITISLRFIYWVVPRNLVSGTCWWSLEKPRVMRILFSVGLLHACKRGELFYQPKSMRSSLPEQPLSMGILVFGKLERKRIKKKSIYFQEVLQTFVALKKWLVGPVWSKCLCLVLVNKLCLKVILYIFLYLPSFSCPLCVVNQWYYKETDFFLACERQTFLLPYRRWGKREGSGDERGETSALRRLEFFYFEEIKFQSLLWFWE